MVAMSDEMPVTPPTDDTPASDLPTDATAELPAAPATDESPRRLLVGIIGAPHGIKGELRVRLVTDFPERLPSISHVYIGDETERRRLRTVRPGSENSAILTIAGITDRDEAMQFRGEPLYIGIRDAKPLEEGEYYWHQLIDMQAVTPEGEPLGIVTSIIQTGANDVYVITQPDGTELLLPALKEVILEIDVPNKRMVAKPLEYL